MPGFCAGVYVIVLRSLFKLFSEEQRRSETPEVVHRTRRDRKYTPRSKVPVSFKWIWRRVTRVFHFFFHMRYIQGYVINRIRAAGQAAVVRPFIRKSVLRGKGNLNVGQNAQTFFSTESSEHFMKERVHDKICTSFVYCGVFFSH